LKVARRVHAEEALREIEQRFRHLSEHTGKFLWISDPQTNQLIYVSPGYEEVWARSRENSYSSPESWRESFESNSGRRSGPPREREKLYQIAGPDGAPRWIRDRMFPVRDEAGEILRIVGVAEDITDAKRMHDELLRNENKLRAFLSVVPDLVFRLRKDGSILEFFAPKDQSLLLPEANLIGKNIKHLLPPHLATEAMQHMAATLKSSQVQTFQYQYLLPDELRDFEVRAVTCGDDEVLALVRDVTDRKRLEREIIEATSREQQRIGQDLHDGLGTAFDRDHVSYEGTRAQAGGASPGRSQEAAEIGKLVLQALTQTRNLARGLFPVELETNGLIAALRDLAATVESTCKVHCTFRTDDSVVIQDNVVGDSPVPHCTGSAEQFHQARQSQKSRSHAAPRRRQDRIGDHRRRLRFLARNKIGWSRAENHAISRPSHWGHFRCENDRKPRDARHLFTCRKSMNRINATSSIPFSWPPNDPHQRRQPRPSTASC
jgi:PAS domain S-box-containing protein